MPHDRRPVHHSVMVRTIVDLRVFELSFDDADGNARVVSLEEMLMSLRHLATYITDHGLEHLHRLRDALPRTPTEFAIFVDNSMELPCLLPVDWRRGFYDTFPPSIRAFRCPTNQVLQNFGIRLARKQQNQDAHLMASLRQELWHFEGAGGPIMEENGIPVAHMYRRAMQHRLRLCAASRQLANLTL